MNVTTYLFMTRQLEYLFWKEFHTIFVAHYQIYNQVELVQKDPNPEKISWNVAEI